MTALAEQTTNKDEGPERRCIATGSRAPKSGLIRFAISPEGFVTPDLAERLPGRGIWVSASRDALEIAVAKNLFARAAKSKVSVPAGLTDHVQHLLIKRCQDLIGLARRADQLVVGFDRVIEALETSTMGAVVIAEDAGRGRADIEQAAGKTAVCRGLRAEELAEAAGKGAVSFLALARGGLADALIEENERLAGVRPVEVDV